MIIDVKSLVAKKKEEIKETVNKYPENEVKLSIIQVGDNPASNSYIKGKLKDCEEVGIVGDLHKFDENVKPFSVLKEINLFLDDYYDRYTGIYLKSKKFLKQIEKIEQKM